jgi:pimeloyl-ACP methyl ester carboxylesterase
MWEIVCRDREGMVREARFVEVSTERWAAEDRVTDDGLSLGPLVAATSRLRWPDATVAKLATLVPTWLFGRGAEDLFQDGTVRPERVRRSPLFACRLPGEGGIPPGLVWLDDAVLLLDKPEGVTEISFRYTEKESDAERRVALELREPGTAWTFFEWFAVLGANSALTSGDDRLRGPRGSLRARIATGDAAGHLVGRVVHVVTGGAGSHGHDPLWERRLGDLERRDRSLADRVPRLDSSNHSRWLLSRERASGMERVEGCELVVLVHGTVSCGMRMASALLGPPSGRAFPATAVVVRHEHDTFGALSANATQLADRIQAFLASFFTFGTDRAKRIEKVLLVGHSRGGLVAVEAAKRLIGLEDSAWPPPDPARVEVLTYGTPHAGTPLVANVRSAGTLLRAFGRASSRMAFAALGLDPVGWAAAWAMRLVRLPEGIAVMHPRSPYVENRRHETFAFRIVAHGARFDPRGRADGFVPSFRKGYLEEVMEGRPNDGVVPTASTVAGHVLEGRASAECAHSDYFHDGTFRDALLDRIVDGTPLPARAGGPG